VKIDANGSDVKVFGLVVVVVLKENISEEG